MAKRLALQAVHHAYAQQLDGPGNGVPLWTGPVLSNASFADDAVTITMEGYTAGGMKLRDVKDCTVCCKGSSPFEVLATVDTASWTEAKVASITATGVVLHAAAGATAVRYAWTDFVECVLVNEADLPMGPFMYEKEGRGGGEASTAPAPAGLVAAPASPILYAKNGAKKDTPIQSPPMGFNSWNFYHCNIDEVEIKAIAAAMATNGMRDAGYQYINIDDCWQVGRENQTGVIIADPSRFPSGMKAVADYVHRLDLKFGVCK